MFFYPALTSLLTLVPVDVKPALFDAVPDLLTTILVLFAAWAAVRVYGELRGGCLAQPWAMIACGLSFVLLAWLTETAGVIGMWTPPRGAVVGLMSVGMGILLLGILRYRRRLLS